MESTCTKRFLLCERQRVKKKKKEEKREKTKKMEGRTKEESDTRVAYHHDNDDELMCWLPAELWAMVCEYLGTADLARLSTTCWTLRSHAFATTPSPSSVTPPPSYLIHFQGYFLCFHSIFFN